MRDYTSVSIPRELLLIVDEKRQGKGYSSRAEFVRQAIRHEIKRIDRGGVQLAFSDYKDFNDFLNKTGMQPKAAITFLDKEMKKLKGKVRQDGRV